ncbi:MAG: MlaD family protein [Betaproteobacteria bacterium]|nr:MlaD family protein [Betaproteobacteria bacterium]
MSLFQDSDRRFAALRRKTWLFFVPALAGLFAVIVLIGIRQNLFTPKTNLFFVVPTATGLTRGMPVDLLGFGVGDVKDMRFEPGPRIQVELSVETRYLRYIPADSTARLSQEGLLSDNAIELVPGPEKSVPISAGGTLRFAREDSLATIAKRLNRELTPILRNARGITNALNDPNGDFRQSLHELKTLAAGLAQSNRDLQALLVSSRIAVNDTNARTARLLSRATGTLRQVDETIRVVSTATPPLVRQSRVLVEHAAAASAKADGLMSRLVTQVPPMLSDSRGLVDASRSLLNGAEGSWPFDRWVHPRRSQTLPIDSVDGLDEWAPTTRPGREPGR